MFFFELHSSPWACRWEAEVLGARSTCGSVHLAVQSSVGMARKSCGRAKMRILAVVDLVCVLAFVCTVCLSSLSVVARVLSWVEI